MIVQRTIPLPEWNAYILDKVAEYWRKRGVTWTHRDEKMLIGNRGSLWGNLASPHIAKVMTIVTVTRAGSGVDCKLELDTRYRGVTPHSKKYLELELAVLESYLISGDLQPEAWKYHKRTASKAIDDMLISNRRHMLTHRGPAIIGSGLKLNVFIVLVFAILLPPITLRWGPSIYPLLHRLEGRPVRQLDTFGRLLFGPIMAGTFGLVFGGLALRLHKLRVESDKCISVSQAGERLGVSAGELEAVLNGRNVQPRFIRDAEPVYELADITGAASLLRPVGVTDTGSLLRPAAAGSLENERLVQAAGGVAPDSLVMENLQVIQNRQE